MRLLSNRLMCQPVLLIVLRKSRMILTEGTESKEGLQNPSYLSWDGTGDEKGNTPAADSEKLVTVKRNRNIDPREQGKFLFWRGVNYCYVSEKCCQKCVRKCCQEKENSPLLVEGGLQGCIFRVTCSYPELTEDHVLTSACVKIFRTVTRNAVNKSV